MIIQRIQYDDDAIDENGVLRPGHKIVVPMQAMDGSSVPTFDAEHASQVFGGFSRSDFARWTRLSNSNAVDGYGRHVSSKPADSEAPYSEYDQRIVDQWRGANR